MSWCLLTAVCQQALLATRHQASIANEDRKPCSGGSFQILNVGCERDHEGGHDHNPVPPSSAVGVAIASEATHISKPIPSALHRHVPVLRDRLRRWIVDAVRESSGRSVQEGHDFWFGVSKATRSSFVDMVSVELSAASVEDIGRLGFSYFQVPVEIGSTSTLPSSAVPDPCVSVTREVPCEQIDG